MSRHNLDRPIDDVSAEPAVSRREFLRRGAVVGAGVLAGPALIGGLARNASAASAAKKVTLTFASYGGPYSAAQQKAWFDPFMKAYPNIKVIQDFPVDYGKIQAMVQAHNVTWDVCDVGNDFGLSRNKSILTPIDCNVVTSCGKSVAGLQNSPWRIAFLTDGFVIGYNKPAVKGKVPQGWADFFDLTKFPGKRAFEDLVSAGVLEAALIADGVSPKHLYPLDLKRAFAKLDTIKDQIIWWQGGSQVEQLLATGEVTMASVWGARIYDLVKTLKKPVGVQWNQHFLLPDYLVVPKGTKHVHEAMLLVNWIVSAKHNAAISNFYPIGPTTRGAKVTDKAIKPWLAASYPKQGIALNDSWWNTNFARVNAKFKAWQTS